MRSSRTKIWKQQICKRQNQVDERGLLRAQPTFSYSEVIAKTGCEFSATTCWEATLWIVKPKEQ